MGSHNDKEKHGKKKKSGFVNQFEGIGFKNEFDDLYDWKFDFSESVQAKLEISSPGDIHEQQADDIARKVVNGEHAGMEVSASTNTIMTKSDEGKLYADNSLQGKLDETKGSGRMLDEDTRSEIESSIGADLSDVRIYTDSKASEMSKSINAKAFTHGQDIYFKEGEFDPDTTEGKELLAHELVHTQQQKNGLSAKLQRVPDVDDPAIKEGFVKTDPPVKTMVNAISSMRVSDNDASMEVTSVNMWEEVVVEWKGYNGWAYCTVGNEKGYLRFDQLVAPLLEYGLDEVAIEAPSFDGDLTEVAKEINAALTSTTLWIPDVDEERLMRAIPVNLSPEQMQQLFDIYAQLYNKDLINLLYEETNPGRFGEGEYLYKALSRITPYRSSADGVAIRSENGNQVSDGATVQYIFEGPRPVQQLYAGRNGRNYYDYPVSPRLFTPRVLYWLVSKPDKDVDSRKMKDATEFQFKFDADDTGLYSVMAVILDESKNILVLRDHVEVISQEQMAQQAFKANQGISEDAFYNLYTQLAITQGKLAAQSTENRDSGITAPRNPAYFNEMVSSWDTYQINYKLKKPNKNEKYVWYVIPESPDILSDENYYFELNHKEKVKIITMKDGTEVFSSMSVDQPSADMSGISLYFLMAKNEPDVMKYTVVCERYKEDKITGVEKYLQYFKSRNSFEEQQRRKEHVEVSNAMSKMVEAQSKIEGKVSPVNAVYVNEETGRSLPLQIFYGKSKEQSAQGKTEYIIIDLTKNAETTYFEGETLIEALEDFDDWQSYPDGLIKIQLGGTVHTIKTTGGSLLSTFGSWSGFLSTLAFAGGVVASLIPGAQGLGAVLFATAFTLGGAASIIGITDNLLKDVPNEKQMALDVMSLASSFIGLGATGLRALGAAREVGSLITASRYMFYTVAIGDVVQGVIMVKDVADQVDTVLKDKSISDSDRLLKLAQVIGSFVASVAMIVFTASDKTALKSSLKKKGVAEEIMAKLEEKPEEMMLVDILSEEEIRAAMENHEDLVKVARRKKTQLEELRIKNDIDEANKRHGLEEILKLIPNEELLHEILLKCDDIGQATRLMYKVDDATQLLRLLKEAGTGKQLESLINNCDLLPPQYQAFSFEQLQAIESELTKWNINGKGVNQGAEHIYWYEAGLGAIGKDNRLEKLEQYYSGTFNVADPELVKKVNMALNDMVSSSLVPPIVINGTKEIYFYPKNGMPAPSSGYSNGQKGLIIIKFNGKYSTFYNSSYKDFKKAI